MATGISLHIGINRYSQADYRRATGRILTGLPNCDQDAIAKMAIANRFGFQSKLFLNHDATIQNLFTSIELAAEHLQKKDFFFLSFSGHGTRASDRNGDEDDGYDEAWCLYNGIVIDDELFDRWKRFRPGVRILVIADSCHSGTSIKDADNNSLPGGRFPDSKAGDVQASGLLLAACQDKQSAFSNPSSRNSLYTYWMLEVLKEYNFCESYRELHNRIARHMPKNSTPNLFLFGPGSDRFVCSRPFKI